MRQITATMTILGSSPLVMNVGVELLDRAWSGQTMRSVLTGRHKSSPDDSNRSEQMVPPALPARNNLPMISRPLSARISRPRRRRSSDSPVIGKVTASNRPIVATVNRRTDSLRMGRENPQQARVRGGTEVVPRPQVQEQEP